jgi:hypothetical protein
MTAQCGSWIGSIRLWKEPTAKRCKRYGPIKFNNSRIKMEVTMSMTKKTKERLEFLASSVCFTAVMAVILYFYVVSGG